MTDNSVANIIWKQMGAGRFQAVTGCEPRSYSENSLTIKLTRNSASASFLKITLTPADTYTMEFTRVRKYELLPVRTVEDVYFDQLQEIFTQVTGLHTHL